MNDDFFSQMCREAQDELASGKKSWREVDSNTLLLAAFGMLSNHLTSKIAKPLWWFAGSVSAGVLGYLVHLIMASGG
jgi:hypothetical protein